MSNVRRPESVKSLVLWVVLSGAPLGAVVAVLAAKRRGDFRAIDLGTLFLPPVVFFVVASEVKSQQQGVGLVFWPIVVAVVSAYAFVLKVFVADRALRLTTLQTSRALFLAMSASALAFAFFAPWWLE
jgi:hypothetical protein